MSRFDLSGGKRGKLDGSLPPGARRPANARPASAGCIVVALVLALLIAAGVGIAIFAGDYASHDTETAEDWQGVEPKPDGEAGADQPVARAGQSVQDALDDAETSVADANREALEKLDEMERNIARARAMAGGESEEAFDEAEKAIAQARKQFEEASGQD